MPRTGEKIESAASVGLRMKHAIGGYERESLRAGQCHEVFVAPGFSASQVTLDFDKNIVLAKDRHQCLEFFKGFRLAGIFEDAFFVACQDEESFRISREFLPEHRGFRLGAAQSGFGDEAAEVLVSGSAGNQDRKDAFVFEREFRADQGADTMFFCGCVQAGRAVKSIAIAQRERRKTEPGGGAHEVLRIRCATQKAEGAAGVELNVGHGRRRRRTQREQRDEEVFALEKSLLPLRAFEASTGGYRTDFTEGASGLEHPPGPCHA